MREYCNRALLLHNGTVLEVGDVDTVCDAYIAKNMHARQRKELEEREHIKRQEEEREKEIKKNKEKGRKEKDAVIEDIQLFDARGNELMEIAHGEPFSIETTVDVRRRRKNLFLAVQIFDNSNDAFLCGNNTHNDHFDCKWRTGKNTIKIFFKDNVFNMGEIYVRAVVFERKGDNDIVIIDTISCKEINEKIVKIVHKEGAGGGIMRIEHKWSKKR